jgi:pimeloyl-ACP methyl ester carboxylesterase
VTSFRRVPLSTGVTLNVGLAGPEGAPPVILLHGFPESHRTWRELVPLMDHRFRLIMPDLRGFAGSDRPEETRAYGASTGVKDLLALADALGLTTFSLVGHDIGGVIAWTAAQARPARIERLAILNAPHPIIFQKSLIEDSGQRRASQYINALKLPGSDRLIGRDLDRFFEQAIVGNAAMPDMTASERQAYITDWSQPGALRAMTNWYRAAEVLVPPPGVTLPIPDRLLRLAGRVTVPTLVVWGMQDPALLPVQLDGLERLVDTLRIVRLLEAGHFTPWEAPVAVAAALEPFLAGEVDAIAPDE